MSEPEISIIIPTMVDPERADSIKAAIDSVLNQSRVKVIPIVVANGDRYDDTLFTVLQRSRIIRFIHLEEGSLPKAIAAGRKLVETPFFSFLDDDDIYLPDTLHARVAPLLVNEELDLTVANGYRLNAQGRGRFFGDLKLIKRKPFLSLLRENWLTSCGGLFRTSSIGSHYFESLPRYLEWTFLGFLLSLDKKQMFFINEPLFEVNETENSLSRSTSYALGVLPGIERMLSYRSCWSVRRLLKQKYIRIMHAISTFHFKNGNLNDAWHFHLKSLRHLAGLKYLSYTYPLIKARAFGKQKEVALPASEKVPARSK